MRVLVVTHGPDLRDNVLWRHLLLQSDEVHLAVPDASRTWDPGSWRIDAAAAARVHPVGRRSLGSATATLLPGLGTTIRRLRPDLVHVDDEPWSVTSQWLVRSGNATVIHAAESVIGSAAWPYRVRRAGLRRVLRDAAGFSAWGRTSLAAFRDAGLPADTPTSILPSKPPSPEVFSAVPPRAPDGQLRVGYVGRLITQKGIDVAVRAVGMLSASGVPSRLDVVGTGPERGRLEALATSAGAAVSFHGPMGEDGVAGFIASMDVIVVPSRGVRNWQEQWCRSALEGLMVGRPVLASNSGELPWSVGVPEWIFPEDDAEQLTRMLRELARPGAAESASARALAAARAVHLDTYAEQLVTLWGASAWRAAT